MSDKNCESCKQKKVSNNQLLLIVLGFYVIFSSIYGTISIFKYIVNQLSH
jgi:hypothetical protein